MSWLADTAAWAVTMVLIMIGWVFFRAASFEDAGNLLTAVFTSGGGYHFETFRTVLTCVAPLAAVEIFQRFARREEVLTVGPFLVRYSALLAVLMSILLLSAETGQDFIYFDF